MGKMEDRPTTTINLKIPRCYKPVGFGQLKSVELHHFLDASKDAYGFVFDVWIDSVD